MREIVLLARLGVLALAVSGCALALGTDGAVIMALNFNDLLVSSIVPAITYGIWIVIAAHLQLCFRAIPREHRTMRPALVWLVLIPFFGTAWNFWVFLGLSASYKRALGARGKQLSNWDSGVILGLAYSICMILCFVPGYGIFAALGGAVFLAMYLYRASWLTKRVLLPSR